MILLASQAAGAELAGLLTANWHNSISPLQTHRIPCEVSPLSRTRPPLLYLSSRGKVRSKVIAGKKITKPSRTRLPSPCFRQCFHLLQHFQAASCTHHTPRHLRPSSVTLHLTATVSCFVRLLLDCKRLESVHLRLSHDDRYANEQKFLRLHSESEFDSDMHQRSCEV